MSVSIRKVYCGPSGLCLRNLVGRVAENNLSVYFKEQKILYVHTGRTAIRMACDLIGIGVGSEVLAPSYNCGSEIDALLHSKASVSLYRVDSRAKVDMDDLARRISNRTRAVYVTHYFGFPQPLDEIKELCSKHGLFLVEDCALSLLSSDRRQKIGMTGDLAVFSLPKTLPLPDGGVLCVNNNFQTQFPRLSEPKKMRIFFSTLPILKASFLRWFFLNVPIDRFGHGCKSVEEGSCQVPDSREPQKRPDIPSGYYYNDRELSKKRVSSLTGRLMKTFSCPEVVAAHRKNFATLNTLLGKCPGVLPLYDRLPDEVSPLCYPIVVDRRDALVEALRHSSIDARAWWRGYHKGLSWSEFPEACFLKDHVLTLPLHQDLTEADCQYMSDRVRSLVC
jgi:dTDP-4-amino-4,6-dideoxygalactose transaminase